MRHANDIRKAVLFGVFRRDLHRQLVQINRQHVGRAELGRRQAENAASASHVNRAASGRDVFFKLLHAHERRLVRARAERHTGVKLQHEVAFLRLVGLPARFDDQTLARAEGLVILLPVLRPILLANALRIERQAAHVKAHVHFGDFAELLLHQMQRLRRARVTLEIRLDEHILAHVFEHVLVDHIPHTVGFLARRHVVAILNRRADRTRVHQHVADDVRAHRGGVHHSFQPIHRLFFLS